MAGEGGWGTPKECCCVTGEADWLTDHTLNNVFVFPGPTCSHATPCEHTFRNRSALLTEERDQVPASLRDRVQFRCLGRTGANPGVSVGGKTRCGHKHCVEPKHLAVWLPSFFLRVGNIHHHREPTRIKEPLEIITAYITQFKVAYVSIARKNIETICCIKQLISHECI